MFKLAGIKYKHILEIAELDIPKQQITCIVGESGGGKTTLLRLLNNMISADAGSIKYKGQDIQTLDPVSLRREVAMLPQRAVIFPGTVRDNLQIGLQFAEREPASEEELQAALRRAQLRKRLEDKAEKLSGGEQQRLALARVILLDPDVLLLDEPSAALDEGTESALVDELVSYVRSAGKTLVMVTHARAIAERIADHMVVVQGGRIVRNGVSSIG